LLSLEAAKNVFVRRAPQDSVNQNAWIRQKGSFGIQGCWAMEVSRTGARLEVGNTQNIPNKFLLLFSKSDSGKNASVIWRRGTEIGVEFFSANPPQPHA
jgi:hypothetical protein